ncbi:MAG: hypothetical protein NTX03_14910 [Bacteroidetes bacterium]|nr:hypothetical protein [Bacteroidota bacterium]
MEINIPGSPQSAPPATTTTIEIRALIHYAGYNKVAFLEIERIDFCEERLPEVSGRCLLSDSPFFDN